MYLRLASVDFVFRGLLFNVIFFENTTVFSGKVPHPAEVLFMKMGEEGGVRTSELASMNAFSSF